MGQCLVTKLSANVANDNIPQLGQIILDIVNWDNVSFMLSGSSKVTLVGDGFINNQGNKEVSNPGTVNITASSAKLFIDNKYSITQFGSQTGLRLKVTPISISELKYLKSNLTVLYAKGFVYGDVTEVAHYNSVTTFSFPGSANLTGSIEKFVEKLVASGKTSGKANLDVRNCAVTLNGSIFSQDPDLIFNNGVVQVTKYNTPSTVYASYDGTTWTYNS